MDLQHRGDQLRMSARIADPPARHRERLGEAADEKDPLLHARHGREADMLLVVGQLRIDLIADDDQVMLFHDLGDRKPILVRHRCAGRIAGIADQKRFGLRRDRRPQRFRRQLELVLRERLDFDRRPPFSDVIGEYEI